MQQQHPLTSLWPCRYDASDDFEPEEATVRFISSGTKLWPASFFTTFATVASRLQTLQWYKPFAFEKDCMVQSSLSARRDATRTRKYCIGGQMVKTVEERKTELLISRLCKLSKTKLRGKGQSCLTLDQLAKPNSFDLHKRFY